MTASRFRLVGLAALCMATCLLLAVGWHARAPAVPSAAPHSGPVISTSPAPVQASAPPPTATALQAATYEDVHGSTTPPDFESRTQALMAQPDQQRMIRWMQARGHLELEVAANGYQANSDATLRQLATRDPLAALTLAERLARHTQPGHMPTQAQVLYRQAAVLGYSAPLERLSSEYAMQSQLRPSSDAAGKAAAMQTAYANAYLMGLRGDPGEKQQLEVLGHFGMWTADLEKSARAEARRLYQGLSADRAELGLPPFDDHLPPEIQQAHHHFQDVVGSALYDALNAARVRKP